MAARLPRLAGLAPVLLLSACGPMSSDRTATATDAQGVSALELSSAAFDPGGQIPQEHTCDGADMSPPIAWTGAPDGTRAFALLVTDPDARGFVHWVLADIPPDVAELRADEGDSIGIPGRNDFGRIGWGGPCPPSGTHRYVFELHALSEPLNLAGTPDADLVRGRLSALSLARGELSGTYRRGG